MEWWVKIELNKESPRCAPFKVSRSSGYI